MSGRLLAKYGFVTVVGLALIAPTVILIVISFSSGNVLFFPPPGFSGRWYMNFFHRSDWTEATLTSLKVGILAMVMASALGTLTALGLVRGRFPGRGLITALVLSPMIVPAVIVGLGMYIFYLKLKLVGTLPVFVLSHAVLGLPFVVVNVAASLRTVDRNLELAARNLGAGPIRTFFSITLPLIMPGVVAGALFAFITSWDEVVLALFLSTPLFRTLPVRMWTGIRFGVDPTVAAASSMVTGLSLVLLVVLLFVRIRSVTSVKERSA
jgi:putative spermidine/putrescine transport system permease protein